MACIGFLSATAFAAPGISVGGGGGGGGRGDGGGPRASLNAGGGVKANVQSSDRGNRNGDDGRRSANYRGNDGINIGGRNGVTFGGDRGGINVGGRNGVSVGRDGRDYIGRSRIGDNGWDRWGIGRMDDSRYRNYSGNQWRYRRYGNDWFYWMPAGYWMFYGDGRWNRYDADSYASYYYGDNYQQPSVAANFSGPYYEDSNGFYSLNGNERVYDPSIRRVANVEGGVQR